MRNLPGPGDPETWGPVTSHPNDPRFDPFEDEDEDSLVEVAVAIFDLGPGLDPSTGWWIPSEDVWEEIHRLSREKRSGAATRLLLNLEDAHAPGGQKTFLHLEVQERNLEQVKRDLETIAQDRRNRIVIWGSLQTW